MIIGIGGNLLSTEKKELQIIQELHNKGSILLTPYFINAKDS